MAVKIYLAGGSVNIEGIGIDLISINSTNFDWSVTNGKYEVKDAVTNHSYTLGLFTNVRNVDGDTFSDEKALIDHLNSIGNVQGVSISNRIVDVQNPIPVANTNLVVFADINESLSDQFNFIGDIADVFNSKTDDGLVDSTSDDPKMIDIMFNTVVTSIAIGIGASGGGVFGNVELFGLFGSSVFELPDESGNDISYNSRIYEYDGTGLVHKF